MGFNRWWREDSRRAMDWLAGRPWNELVRNPLEQAHSEFGSNVRCTSSSQCSSGYACVNGSCLRTTTAPTGGGTSNGQINNAGGCDQNDPNSPCNSSGQSACSTTPNCGDIPNPRPEECCGTRCCSFGSASSDRPGVNCYCGKCPKDEGKSCNIFCDGYSSANGESVMGCTPESSCTECTSCSLFSGTCQPISGAPCWCEGSQCQDCLSCDTNPASPSFGLCIPARSGACSACSHVDAYKCPCGETVGPITACRVYGPGGSGYGGNVILSSKSAQEIAQEQCEPASTCDPCKGDCTSKTYCNEEVPPCPNGMKCTDNGTISGGGQSCSIRTECDMSNVPEKCKECDCNCDNDCQECEYCAADGTCQPDPACDQCPEGQKLCPGGNNCCNADLTCVSTYRNVFQTSANGDTATYFSVGGPANYSVRPANGENPQCSSKNPTRDTLVITNSKATSGSVCSNPQGVERTIAFSDPQCFGPGTNRPDIAPFVPVLTESTIISTSCCGGSGS